MFFKYPTRATLGFEICQFFLRMSMIFYLSKADKIMYWSEQASLARVQIQQDNGHTGIPGNLGATLVDIAQ